MFSGEYLEECLWSSNWTIWLGMYHSTGMWDFISDTNPCLFRSLDHALCTTHSNVILPCLTLYSITDYRADTNISNHSQVLYPRRMAGWSQARNRENAWDGQSVVRRPRRILCLLVVSNQYPPSKSIVVVLTHNLLQEIWEGLQRAHTGRDMDGLTSLLSENESMDSRVI